MGRELITVIVQDAYHVRLKNRLRKDSTMSLFYGTPSHLMIDIYYYKAPDSEINKRGLYLGIYVATTHKTNSFYGPSREYLSPYYELSYYYYYLESVLIKQQDRLKRKEVRNLEIWKSDDIQRKLIKKVCRKYNNRKYVASFYLPKFHLERSKK